MSRQHLPRFDETSSLDTHLASGLCVGHAKNMYLRYSLNGLRHRIDPALALAAVLAAAVPALLPPS